MADLRKILVVDDEQEFLDVLSKKLAEENFEVVTATTAQEAIEKTRTVAPKLILMDIVLPDMEGSEAVRLLAEDPATEQIPVIFLSGIISKEEGTPVPEIKVGGRLYTAVSKPFTIDDLLREIRKVLWQAG